VAFVLGEKREEECGEVIPPKEEGGEALVKRRGRGDGCGGFEGVDAGEEVLELEADGVVGGFVELFEGVCDC